MPGEPVLHIIESRGPGGAETVVVELLNRIGRKSLAVVPTLQSWLARTLPASSVRAVSPTRGGLLPIDFRYLRALRRAIREETPAVVHAHSFDSGFYAALALLGSGTPLVVTYHGASDVTRFGLKNRMKWLVMRRASVLICVSRSLAALARETPGLPVDRLVPIYNGTDVPDRVPAAASSLRERLRLSSQTTLVGALGNLRAPKAYDRLLPAIRILIDEGIDIHLVIAGDDSGPVGSAIREQRTALALDTRVTLTGFTDNPTAFLSELDLFVLSSRTEGFSLSTLQAMAAGLPIVATRSGGPEELVEHDVHGWLVRADSSAALSDGIRTLLSDPERRQRLGAAARKRARESFSIERMVDNYRRLYETLGAR